MVKIRLKRMGKKHAPFYRIVVAESTTKRDGKFIEEIGYYYPNISPNEKLVKEIQVDVEKYKAWIKKGAQPSDAISQIAKKAGLV